LARILVMKPDVMLLDEPSNHLDIESLIWLESFLKNYPGALLMTSHDRELMNRIVGKIIEIDGGDLITYSGNYDFYEQQRAIQQRRKQRLQRPEARNQGGEGGGAVREERGHARQGAPLHRALQGASR